MGLLATSGKSSEGLIIYLLNRKKYPIKQISDNELNEINRRKKISFVSIIFIVIGAIGFVFCLLTGQYTNYNLQNSTFDGCYN